MNDPRIGGALAAVFVVLCVSVYGWPGLAAGIGGVVFWLLLQFNRAVRVMRLAAGKPVGRVDSAVMLNARLRRGMRMLDIVTVTRSLGRRAREGRDDEWLWDDTGGSRVRLFLTRAGRLDRWSLERPPAEEFDRSPLTRIDAP